MKKKLLAVLLCAVLGATTLGTVTAFAAPAELPDRLQGLTYAQSRDNEGKYLRTEAELDDYARTTDPAIWENMDGSYYFDEDDKYGNDDGIVKFIPREYFLNDGTHYAVCGTYGYYIKTEPTFFQDDYKYIYKGDNARLTISKLSAVVVFKVVHKGMKGTNSAGSFKIEPMVARHYMFYELARGGKTAYTSLGAPKVGRAIIDRSRIFLGDIAIGLTVKDRYQNDDKTNGTYFTSSNVNTRYHFSKTEKGNGLQLGLDALFEGLKLGLSVFIPGLGTAITLIDACQIVVDTAMNSTSDRDLLMSDEYRSDTHLQQLYLNKDEQLAAYRRLADHYRIGFPLAREEAPSKKYLIGTKDASPDSVNDYFETYYVLNNQDSGDLKQDYAFNVTLAFTVFSLNVSELDGEIRYNTFEETGRTDFINVAYLYRWQNYAGASAGDARNMENTCFMHGNELCGYYCAGRTAVCNRCDYEWGYSINGPNYCGICGYPSHLAKKWVFALEPNPNGLCGNGCKVSNCVHVQPPKPQKQVCYGCGRDWFTSAMAGGSGSSCYYCMCPISKWVDA